MRLRATAYAPQRFAPALCAYAAHCVSLARCVLSPCRRQQQQQPLSEPERHDGIANVSCNSAVQFLCAGLFAMRAGCRTDKRATRAHPMSLRAPVPWPVPCVGRCRCRRRRSFARSLLAARSAAQTSRPARLCTFVRRLSNRSSFGGRRATRRRPPRMHRSATGTTPNLSPFDSFRRHTHTLARCKNTACADRDTTELAHAKCAALFAAAAAAAASVQATRLATLKEPNMQCALCNSHSAPCTHLPTTRCEALAFR